MYVVFERQPGGVVDLVIYQAPSTFDPSVELARVGLSPQELDALLTQGRSMLWDAMGVS